MPRFPRKILAAKREPDDSTGLGNRPTSAGPPGSSISTTKLETASDGGIQITNEIERRGIDPHDDGLAVRCA